MNFMGTISRPALVSDHTDFLADINYYQFFFMSMCFLIPTHNLLDVYNTIIINDKIND